MASLVGPGSSDLPARDAPLLRRSHWAEMAAVEIPKDRWASLGVLAFGATVAIAALAVHLL